VEDGDVVVVGQPVLAGRVRVRVLAVQLLRVAAGFEQQHLEAVLGEARGERAAARARSDDDVFVIRAAISGGCQWSLPLRTSSGMR
jgi:hypothetical protein